jgi:FMN phosphatase YigB (HAD superfamily)
MRKPDAEIFHLGLDITQVPADQVVYIDDTPMFAQVAEGPGIHCVRHTDCGATCARLASFGLQNDEGHDRETS